MNRCLARALVILALCAAPTIADASKKKPVATEDEPVPDAYAHVQLIILGTSKDYHKLETEARAISRKAHVPFDMQGMVYDKKNGLVCKDDPVWAGSYLCRRDCVTDIGGKLSPYISIERSDGYPGMKEGYYIIVADVCSDPKDVRADLKKYRRIVPDAYACGTTVYILCRH